MSGISSARLIGFAALFFVITTGAANAQFEDDEFNVEIEANIEFADFETNVGLLPNPDPDTLTIGYVTLRFYRGNVRITDDPIAETAFINRIMNFSMSLGWASLEEEFPVADGDGPYVGGAIRIADPRSALTASVKISRAEADVNASDLLRKEIEYRIAYFWKSDWNFSSWEAGLLATDSRFRDTGAGFNKDLSRLGGYVRGVWQWSSGLSISTESQALWAEQKRLSSMSLSSDTPQPVPTDPDIKTGGYYLSQGVDVHITPLFSVGGTVATQFSLFADDTGSLSEPVFFEGRVAWNFNNFFGARASFAGNSENDDTTILITVVGRK